MFTKVATEKNVQPLNLTHIAGVYMCKTTVYSSVLVTIAQGCTADL